MSYSYRLHPFLLWNPTSLALMSYQQLSVHLSPFPSSWISLSYVSLISPPWDKGFSQRPPPSLSVNILHPASVRFGNVLFNLSTWSYIDPDFPYNLCVASVYLGYSSAIRVIYVSPLTSYPFLSDYTDFSIVLYSVCCREGHAWYWFLGVLLPCVFRASPWGWGAW